MMSEAFMIRGYSDHAANERTFLAWVRTAIAGMAFGFLVEKFDLFLEIAAPSLSGRQLSVPGQMFANFVGLSLIVVGTGMVAVAAIRFLQIAKHIDTPHSLPGAGSRLDVALATLPMRLLRRRETRSALPLQRSSRRSCLEAQS